MTATVRIDDSDRFGRRELDDLAQFQTGPCVSLYQPTHRASADIQQDPVRLRNLVAEARQELATLGRRPRDIDELLAPADRLAGDRDFWRHQSDGLAVFLAPGVMRTFRAPIAFAELAVVATKFLLRPLLPLLMEDESFWVLALSQNTVGLFQGSRHAVAEVDTGRTPTSMAEALAHEDPEKQLQVRSTGPTSTGQYHGHGGGDEDQKAALERYFRAVDRGLAQLGIDTSRPLILASVSYYGPIYRSVSDHPRILDEMIVGNPEDLSATELHSKAWPLIAPRLAAGTSALQDRYRQRRAVGATAEGLGDVTAAATGGRIEVVFLPRDQHCWAVHDQARPSEVHVERQPGDVDLLDEVARLVIRTGGDVRVVDDEHANVAAILRYP